MISLFPSFAQKALNEKAKWLKFHGLKYVDFKTGTNASIRLDWKEYDMSNEDRKLYRNFFFFSPDKTYFLDLDSYSLILEKDSSGKLTWTSGDPDSKIQLVRNKDLVASELLFFGTTAFVETGFWKNNHLFELFGFQIDNNIYIPTIWKFDVKNKTLILLDSKKKFKKRPNNYLIKTRLIGIKER